MAARVLVAGCLIGAAVTIAVPGAGAAGRLRGLRPRPRRPSARPQPHQLARIGAGLGGLVTVLILGGWAGVIAGCLVAVVLDRFLRRLESAAARAHRLHAAADLPVAADLLAAVLRGGAPADRAAALVADALGGPLGELLARVARATLLGAPPEEAWGHLSAVAGSERLIRAAVRSSHSGAALAGALTRVADDLRADRAVAAEAAAHRAGVLIVLPLGLCFLPAFVLAGLVPVIVAVLGDVL
jgi:pilus assembly protein TadC